MFKYQDTNKVSQLRESQYKVVTEVRTVTYLNDNPNPKILEPVTTTGYETVKELVVSPGKVVTPRVVGSKTVDNRNKEEKRKPFDLLKQR
jgi:hypothetical protein